MNAVSYLRPESAPHSVEAEQAILGAILLDARHIGTLTRRGGASLFHDPLHAKIFEVAAEKEKGGFLVSPITVHEVLRAEEGLSEVGGGRYLTRLAGAAPASASVTSYADMLADLTRKRGIVAAISEASAAITKGEDPASHIAARLEAAITAVTSDDSTGPVSMLKAVSVAMDQIKAAYEGTSENQVRSGIADLDRMISGFYPGELVLIGGRPSMGKAQPLTEPVLLANGEWRDMGDLTIGDELASSDGRCSVVTGVFPQGRRKIYRVTFSDGRWARCCGDHLWQVESSRFLGNRVVSTDRLREMISCVRHKCRTRVPLLNGKFGNGSCGLPLDPWLVGAILGDGYLNSLTPTFTNPSESLVSRMTRSLPDGVKMKKEWDIGYRLSSARGDRNQLTDALRELGMMGHRAEEKSVPTLYMTAGYEERKQVLVGLLDTDGWVEPNGNIRFSSASHQLALDVVALARSLGGKGTVHCKESPKYSYRGELRTGQPAWVCSLSLPEPSSMFSMPEKAMKARRSSPVSLVVMSIEEDGEEYAQCIAVSHPDHLYVTRGYTLTHNTGVALSIALNAARAGHGVVIASLEMNPEAMAMRALSEATAQNRAAVTYANMRKGDLSDPHLASLQSAAQQVAELPIVFLPRNYSDIGALFAGSKQAKRAMGDKMRLLIVDYAQLLRSSAKSRYEQITEISIALKALAGTLNVPVIALSQLSRGIESRDDKRPMLSDLRESGQLEQDADAVLFCYRDSYYLEREKPNDDAKAEDLQAWQDAMRRQHNKLEIIVAKQRQGEIGTAHVMFNPALNLVWDR